MGLAVTDKMTGCPSGLQEVPIQDTDPFGNKLDLSSYVLTKDDGSQEIDLIVQGAHCGGCLSKIERGIGKLDGVSAARMNLSTLKLHTEWSGTGTGPDTLIQALSDMGYGAAPYEISASQSQSQDELKSLLRAMAVAGFATMNIMLLSVAIWSGGGEMQASTHTIFHWISAMIALPAVAYAGQPFFRSAWAALKNKRTNMDVPISLAVCLACGLSLYETVKGNPDTYFDAAVMLLFLLLIGRYLDAKLRLKTGEAAQRLAAMQVTSATRIMADGALETIPTRLVKPNDRLLIPAGQRIPVDGLILTGRSELDTHIATGETVPSLSGPDDMIYAGMINLTAPLTMKVVSAHSDSFLSEITKLVEIGEQGKSNFVKIADRAARAYVPIVHSLALLTLIGWLLAGAELRPALLNAIAVLIITCPCALGLAVPAVQIVASGRLFKHGVLIKSGDALERLAKTRWVIFDKTGTLTLGAFTLDNKAEISRKHIEIAAALASQSRHPIAKALHPFAGNIIAGDVKEIPGIGLRGIIDGQIVTFGTRKNSKARNMSGVSSESWLQIGEDAPICFRFSDTLRDDAPQTVRDLTRLGLTSELLSGDKKHIAASVAASLGIAKFKGEVAPKDKQNILYQRLSEARYPLMVGDGINDAPALAAAYASASLATASDISRSAADIILQGDKLSSLPKAIKIARQSQRRVIENLSFAVIYNLVAVPLAIFGFVNPLIAALAMSGSSLIVTLNALRMIRS